ncbi:unnamed protein product [Closterium sp. Naga37s-1]|nr:unnamed protein product [Closterium sp. Naga37s-1]
MHCTPHVTPCRPALCSQRVVKKNSPAVQRPTIGPIGNISATKADMFASVSWQRAEVAEGGGEGSSRGVTETPSTAQSAPGKRQRVGVKYIQQRLWGAPPPRTSASPPKTAEREEEADENTAEEASFDVIKHRFDTEWSGKFSWLRLVRKKDGRPGLKCDICIKYGDPAAHTSYGVRGEGARDLQIGSIRTHVSTRAHKQAVKEQESAEADKQRQVTLMRWQTTDTATRHIIRILHIALFICKADAPIAMFVPLCWEALAAKDAAEAVPELSMVDEVVRAFSNILGQSGVKYQKFQNLQQVFCKTNLEAQGIFDARWLSRGEALERLLDVLPAAIVLLKEYR